MTTEIDRLIRLLDDDSTDVCEDAKFTLMSIGPEVVEPLAAAVGSLHPVAQLCAIEVFDHFDAAAAVPALIGLLGSPDRTVRIWSMESVAALGAHEALPALRAAHRRLRAAGEPPDSGEAVGLRLALTALGARQEVLPPLTASLRTTAGDRGPSWPSERLADVVHDLADHDQAVLGFTLWLVFRGRGTLIGHERLGRPLDVDRPWRQVVEDAREAALVEAASVEPRPDLFATVEWIGRGDV
ncbi:HEAT repeat domain-containing protein [Saccharothrix saharensis]|uniref:HEAT repeat domain-containing protein n=1 Tax=Saccharothrix saharensis TaxID=571190 RepID=UPI0036B22E7B